MKMPRVLLNDIHSHLLLGNDKVALIKTELLRKQLEETPFNQDELEFIEKHMEPNWLATITAE